MENLKFTKEETELIYRISFKVINNTYLDPVSGNVLHSEWHNFEFSSKDIKHLKNINNQLSLLFGHVS